MPFACVLAHDFSVQAALRCDPEEVRAALHNFPVAILDGPDSLLRISACNAQAELAGIAIGMTKAQAEQCRGLVMRRRAVEQERSEQAALLDCASRFSPCVEDTCPGAVTLDAAGTERIFGPPLKLAHELADAARAVGLEVDVAIAS